MSGILASRGRWGSTQLTGRRHKPVGFSIIVSGTENDRTENDRTAEPIQKLDYYPLPPVFDLFHAWPMTWRRMIGRQSRSKILLGSVSASLHPWDGTCETK